MCAVLSVMFSSPAFNQPCRPKAVFCGCCERDWTVASPWFKKLKRHSAEWGEGMKRHGKWTLSRERERQNNNQQTASTAQTPFPLEKYSIWRWQMWQLEITKWTQEAVKKCSKNRETGWQEKRRSSSIWGDTHSLVSAFEQLPAKTYWSHPFHHNASHHCSFWTVQHLIKIC